MKTKKQHPSRKWSVYWRHIQYYIGPPFAVITACNLLGIDRNKLWVTSNDMSFHASCRTVFRVVWLVMRQRTSGIWICRSNSSYKYSIRFKSGDCGRECSWCGTRYNSQVFTSTAVCFGSLSCWKIQLEGRPRRSTLGCKFSSKVDPFFKSINTNCPTPAEDIRPHTITFLLPCLTVGQRFSFLRASLFRLQTYPCHRSRRGVHTFLAEEHTVPERVVVLLIFACKCKALLLIDHRN